MTADPLAYLHATLDAAQAEAEAARGGSAGVWSVDAHPHYNGCRIEDDRGEVVVYDEGSPTPEQAAHMARHAPAAVLRRIAADRKTLAEHADDGYGDCVRCAGPGRPVEVNGMAITEREAVPHPCTTVRNIAEGWGITVGE